MTKLFLSILSVVVMAVGVFATPIRHTPAFSRIELEHQVPEVLTRELPADVQTELLAVSHALDSHTTAMVVQGGDPRSTANGLPLYPAEDALSRDLWQPAHVNTASSSPSSSPSTTSMLITGFFCVGMGVVATRKSSEHAPKDSQA